MIYWRLFQESVKFALHALVVNKLRTMLSLLGITIGIFAIIIVFAVVDSLEYTIRKSISGLGDRVVYVQKWSWGPEDGAETYAWWKYFNRPEPSYREFRRLQQNAQQSAVLAYMFTSTATVKYRANNVSNAAVNAVSHDFQEVWQNDIGDGRYFSELESSSGRPVAIIGFNVADGLFQNEDPLGKDIRIWGGRKARVIGVYAKKGEDIFGSSPDDQVFVPLEFARQIFPDRYPGSTILAKAHTIEGIDPMIQEVRSGLRSMRKLKPGTPDSFSFNRISLVSNSLDSFFITLRIAGIFIGGFSILVGGFGIANIMFVSVKERTNQIGIQKALGAKNYFILLQFLFESVFLCLLGGIIGLILVFFTLEFAAKALEFDIFLSAANVLQGVVISVVIGLISGIFPAFFAARMQPVDAIRSGI
jgi:putative ABC transport system permease protein